MADENKKYTNRLRDKSTNEVYFIYDEEALHADSSISLLTNDAGYVKGSELSDLVASNPAFVKHDQLTTALTNYATIETVDSTFVKKADLESLAVAGEKFFDYSQAGSFDLSSREVGASLANIEQNTVYKIAEAVNAPTGTGNSGFYSVRKLNNDFLKEEWQTESGQAQRYRIYNKEVVSKYGNPRIVLYRSDDPLSYFEEQEDAYYLNAGGMYIISGLFSKKIIIKKLVRSEGVVSAIEDVPSTNSNISTILILYGCFLEPNAETAIEYPSRYGQLAISAIGNNNVIMIDSANITGELSELNEHSLRSTAIIHSKSNLFFGGVGKLSLMSNVKNHAIKADNVSVKDAIQLYIDLQEGHDGINIGDEHRLLITDGCFIFKNCHEAIDGGIDGIVNILGGTFTFENNTKDIDCSGCAKPGRAFNMLGKTSIDLSNSENVINITPSNIREIYGNGYFTARDGSPVDFPADGNGVITITTSGLTAHGYFNKKQFYITGSTEQNSSVDLYLEDAYIDNSERKTTSGKGQTILYTPETGKLAIRCKEGTVNFVTQTQSEDTGDGYGAIKSKNNLTIQGAGSIYVRSIRSDAIDGSDVIIKGNGFRYFESLSEDTVEPKAGICGKSVTIGEDDAVLEEEAENSYQTIVTKKNSIIAKKNKKGEKGIIDILKYQLGLIFYPDPEYGPTAETSITNANAEPHDGLYDTLTPLSDEYLLEYVTGELDNRFGKVTNRTVMSVTDWKVFISSEEVNNRINALSETLLATIETLKTRITKLEHKHLVYYAPVAPGDHTNGNIEYWYCPECDEYYSDEEGLHEITRAETIIPKLISDDEQPVDTVDENGEILETEAYDSNGNLLYVDVIENN